jgi:hypothetical protein
MREHVMPATRLGLERLCITLRVSDMDGHLVAELRTGDEGVRSWSFHPAPGVKGLLTFTFYDGLSGSFVPAEAVPNCSEHILCLFEILSLLEKEELAASRD